jgi:hypothetical protein
MATGAIMEKSKKSPEEEESREEVVPLRNPGNGLDLERVKSEEKGSGKGHLFLIFILCKLAEEVPEEKSVQDMENHVGQMISQKVQMPEVVVNHKGQKKQGQVVNSVKLGKDLTQVSPRVLSNEGIIGHIQIIIKAHGQGLVVEGGPVNRQDCQNNNNSPHHNSG